MISDRTQDWIQIAGIFGVIISLIFVGAQLKQAQSIARLVIRDVEKIARQGQ